MIDLIHPPTPKLSIAVGFSDQNNLSFVPLAGFARMAHDQKVASVAEHLILSVIEMAVGAPNMESEMDCADP
jgi:hypothetical protein